MKVLITGIAGMIGSACARVLLNNNHEVHGVDDLSGGNPENVPYEALGNCSMMDILDYEMLDGMFSSRKFDAVIHCAAMAAEILSPHVRRRTIQQNALGTTNIVNCCVNHGVKVLAFTSSIAVYGRCKPPFSESDEPWPADPYGLTKLYSEKDIQMAHEFYGLNYTIFRPHNVAGPAQNFSDAYRNVLAIHIRQALGGEPLTVFGDGSQTRSFTPVEYVAEVICASLNRPKTWNQVYNVGSDQPYSVLQAARMISDEVGIPENFRFENRREEAHAAHSSHEKVLSAFPDIRPTKPLSQTIKEMVGEAKGKVINPPKKLPIEIEKNLPEIWK